eukprot:scaffold8150_cov45-Tisochrysis_lutea.AAC.2
MALWHERAGDVHLEELARTAALVEPVEEEHGAAAHHRLPQHAHDGGLVLVLDLHVRVDPVPRGRKDLAPLRQPPLPQLAAHENGHERPVLELHHELARECRLACRGAGGDEEARGLLGVARRVGQARVLTEDPRDHAICPLGGASMDAVQCDRDALTEHVQPSARDDVDDTRVLSRESVRPPGVQDVKGGERQLERRVIPRVEEHPPWRPVCGSKEVLRCGVPDDLGLGPLAVDPCKEPLPSCVPSASGAGQRVERRCRRLGHGRPGMCRTRGVGLPRAGSRRRRGEQPGVLRGVAQGGHNLLPDGLPLLAALGVDGLFSALAVALHVLRVTQSSCKAVELRESAAGGTQGFDNPPLTIRRSVRDGRQLNATRLSGASTRRVASLADDLVLNSV